jgi:hypothetical protein
MQAQIDKSDSKNSSSESDTSKQEVPGKKHPAKTVKIRNRDVAKAKDNSKEGCQRQRAIIFMTAWDSGNNIATAETSATAGLTVTAETIALGASSINASI